MLQPSFIWSSGQCLGLDFWAQEKSPMKTNFASTLPPKTTMDIPTCNQTNASANGFENSLSVKRAWFWQWKTLWYRPSTSLTTLKFSRTKFSFINDKMHILIGPGFLKYKAISSTVQHIRKNLQKCKINETTSRYLVHPSTANLFCVSFSTLSKMRGNITFEELKISLYSIPYVT